MSVHESVFERKLVQELQQRYPGAFVLKNDPNYIQGIPDRIFLYGDFWAAFDTKRSKNSPVRPNQPYYIDLFNEMSMAMFVYPENKEVFLNEIHRSLSFKR